MAVIQSTYSERMGRAVAGMPADMRNWDGITRNCETAAGIAFGVAVGRGDTDPEKGCKLGGAVVDFLGVALRDITLEARTTIDKYAENENVGIKTNGSVWVRVGDTPGPDDPVYYVSATGVFQAASGGGVGPVVGARWMTDTITVGGVAICKLHLGNANQAAA